MRWEVGVPPLAQYEVVDISYLYYRRKSGSYEATRRGNSRRGDNSAVSTKIPGPLICGEIYFQFTIEIQ